MTDTPNTDVLSEARAREVLDRIANGPRRCYGKSAVIEAMLAFAKEATPPAINAAVPAGFVLVPVDTLKSLVRLAREIKDLTALHYETRYRARADADVMDRCLATAPEVASEDRAARDRRMYEQGRRDERAGEPEAFI